MQAFRSKWYKGKGKIEIASQHLDLTYYSGIFTGEYNG